MTQPSTQETPERDFNCALEAFRALATEVVQAHYKRNDFKFALPGVTIQKGGKRYIKLANIESRDGDITTRSVHSFVEVATGDIFFPAGWKSPAKHARGNIYDEDAGRSSMTLFGGIRSLR